MGTHTASAHHHFVRLQHNRSDALENRNNEIFQRFTDMHKEDVFHTNDWMCDCVCAHIVHKQVAQTNSSVLWEHRKFFFVCSICSCTIMWRPNTDARRTWTNRLNSFGKLRMQLYGSISRREFGDEWTKEERNAEMKNACLNCDLLREDCSGESDNSKQLNGMFASSTRHLLSITQNGDMPKCRDEKMKYEKCSSSFIHSHSLHLEMHACLHHPPSPLSPLTPRRLKWNGRLSVNSVYEGNMFEFDWAIDKWQNIRKEYFLCSAIPFRSVPFTPPVGWRIHWQRCLRSFYLFTKTSE